MRILRCDLCGQEHHDATGICANDKQHGYETLTPRNQVEGLVDVCAECFLKLRKALSEAAYAAEQAARTWERTGIAEVVRALKSAKAKEEGT